MAFGTKVAFEPLRSLAHGSISGTYAAVGTATAHHTRILILENTTDVTLTVSFDGINDNLIMQSNSFKLFDFTANEVTPDGYFLPENTIIYVKQTSGGPTVNSLYVSVIYAAGGI